MRNWRVFVLILFISVALVTALTILEEARNPATAGEWRNSNQNGPDWSNLTWDNLVWNNSLWDNLSLKNLTQNNLGRKNLSLYNLAWNLGFNLESPQPSIGRGSRTDHY